MKRAPYAASLVCGLVLAALTTGAWSQPYPSKPIRFIVPFAPGGTGDSVGRLIGQQLAAQLGQPVVIDNRLGAGGVIGTDLVAKSAPDGYTLLLGSISPVAAGPALYPNLPYDPLRDLGAVTMIAAFPLVLVVDPSLPARSVQELVALAKARPGKLNFGSAGHGTMPHLTGQLFKAVAGIEIVHVPYKGGVAAITDISSGQIALYFGAPPVTLPIVKTGRIRALAVTSLQRSPAAPELPTIAESRFPGFEATTWYGLLVPARTPREIVNRLHAEMLRAIASAEVRKLLALAGSEPIGNTPDEFSEQIRSEIAKWKKVIEMTGTKVE